MPEHLEGALDGQRKGKRAEKKQVFVLGGRRTSTEALLTIDGIVSVPVVEASMAKAGFAEYLEPVMVRPSFV